MYKGYTVKLERRLTMKENTHQDKIERPLKS